VSSALVLGERGSGLTTFVGLLYTAQVRMGTEMSDQFRFSADRESILRIGEIYGSLGDGRFPEMDVNWELHPLSFVFGFRRGRLSSLSRRSSSENGEFDTVRVQVGGIPADEIAELRDHDAILDAGMRALLRSCVLIPLVDASWLSPEPTEIGGLPMARYDQLLANTLELLRKFLAAETDRRARRMYPLFVVTKFDRTPPDVLGRLEAPSGPPEEWTREDRRTFGKRLLQSYLPKTAAFLGQKLNGGVTIEAPGWFFSSVRTEERAGETRIVRRLRAPLGGWEPEYPFDEYRALLERLGDLAHRLPDDSES
jgi:hypothetical protein